MDSYEDLQTERPANGWRVASRPQGFVEHAASALHQTPELHRFTELFAAFMELAGERGDLQVRGSAFPPFGFAVRLQPRPTSAGGELSLWPAGGRLSTWSRTGNSMTDGTGDRSVHIDLRASFRWETLVFTDAGRLAFTLLWWMERQVRAEDGAADGAGNGAARTG